MSIKTWAIEKIKKIFIKHGAMEIDTPVFELKETLMGKYGEEGNKLIYDLEDQGGELLSLRYDLTVPFARYMGLNNINKMKRYHIGKVYRRDQPNTNKGRFREFYQCDLDIAGKSDIMMAESEILKIVVEILKEFDLEFKIKISHRKLLEAIIEQSECPAQKFKSICSSIDKLDKKSWEEVEEEMIYEKGLNKNQTQNIKKFVTCNGNVVETLNFINKENLFKENEKARQSLQELQILSNYLKIYKITDYVEFDLSLARGLDYYTGLIFEGVLKQGNLQLGSIVGGGRYDELIGMFSSEKIPSIGGSIGIERLFVFLEENNKQNFRESQTEFLVSTIGKQGVVEKKMEIVNLLWDTGLSAEVINEHVCKPDRQLKYALENYIPFIIWIGEEEVAKKQVKIKNLQSKEEEIVSEGDLVGRAKELSDLYDLKMKKEIKFVKK